MNISAAFHSSSPASDHISAAADDGKDDDDGRNKAFDHVHRGQRQPQPDDPRGHGHALPGHAVANVLGVLSGQRSHQGGGGGERRGRGEEG